MKTHLLLLGSMLLLSFQLTARKAEATFRAGNDAHMVVIIDGKKVNALPSEVVRVRNVRAGKHEVRIRVFRFGRAREINRRIYLKDGYKSKFVVRANGRHGSIKLSKVREEPLYRKYDYNNHYHKKQKYSDYGKSWKKHDKYRNHQCSIAEHFDVDRLLYTMKRRRFDSEKLAFAKHIVKHKSLFAEDVYRIMKSMSFESNRLEFAGVAYDSVCDKDNFPVVYDALSHRSSIRELEDCINELEFENGY